MKRCFYLANLLLLRLENDMCADVGRNIANVDSLLLYLIVLAIITKVLR